MSRSHVRVALEQVSVTPGRVADNQALCIASAESAFQRGADIVVLPELVTSGYVTDRDRARSLSEELDGPSLDAFLSCARTYGGLIAYGFCERRRADLFNSVAIVGPDGVVLHYRKLHPFDREKGTYEPGDLGLPVVATDYGVLGVCVCYDLRFVEVLRSMSLRGAELVIAPAAWVAGFDKTVPVEGGTQHVDSIRVQANLDQVAVVAVSQVAGTAHEARTLGGSAAFDARGELLAGPLSRTGPDSAIAEVDLADVRASRVRSETIRPRADRRTDVYSVGYAGVRW